MKGGKRGLLQEAFFNGNGIARRLILWLILCSTAITTVITALELYRDYRSGLTRIDAGFEFIGNSYLPAIVDSVWVSDHGQIQTQLDGLLRLPDVEFIGVSVDGAPRWSVGKPTSLRTRAIEVPLLKEYRGQQVQIGALRVVASVDRVIERLWASLLFTLVSNGIKTLLVAGFMLLLFQWLVTQHLTTLASFVRQLDPRSRGKPRVQLNRSASGRWRPDSLDFLADSINRLCGALEESHAQRETAFEQLGESELRFRLAMEASDEGLWDWDAKSDRVYYSPGWSRTLGFSHDEVPKTYEFWAERLHPEDRDRTLKALRDHLEQRSPAFVAEHRLLTKSGEWRWVLGRGRVAERDDHGAPLRIVGTMTDISERKRAEEELARHREHLEELVETRTRDFEQARNEAVRASQAKSEFLSRMSHELRTPMNAILGFAQIIEMSKPTAEQRRWAGEIRNAGDHLLELIDELLDLSRIEAGRLNLRIEPVKVRQAVNEALQIVAPLIRSANVSVTVTAAVEEAAVRADAVRLRQILVNLLSNAAKYNRNGGRIEISCEPVNATRLRIAVSDTGGGIAPEQLANAFKPFERLGAERTGIEGTGIGLALSKQLAELMDGELGVASQIGEGSTFWVVLRSANADSAVALPPAEALATGAPSGCVALYVEDNATNRVVMQAMFEKLPGSTLILAENGQEGLELAQRRRPQVILLDIHLPDIDGFEVLSRLKADSVTRSIPVVALTADAMPAEIERGKAAGFDRYLTKPVRLAELVSAIETLRQPQR